MSTHYTREQLNTMTDRELLQAADVPVDALHHTQLGILVERMVSMEWDYGVRHQGWVIFRRFYKDCGQTICREFSVRCVFPDGLLRATAIAAVLAVQEGA